MSQSYEFYSERAQEAAGEAKSAELANVRERHERAAKTWTALANQAHKIRADREKAEATKAAQREHADREAAEKEAGVTSALRAG